MSKHECMKCGKDPARGFSTINQQRYCHEGPSPTCYERVWYEDLGFGTDEWFKSLTATPSSTGDAQ